MRSLLNMTGMMKVFNSLRARLIIPVIGISLTLLTATIVFLGYRQSQDVRLNTEIQARANLQLIADYASVPLIFNQPEDALDVLSRLRNIRSVLSAAIYDANNGLFVSYGRATPTLRYTPELENRNILTNENSMLICVPIVHRNERYGSLVAEIDLRVQQRLIKELFWLFLMVFSAMGGLAVITAFLFERKFLKPILLLTERFRGISARHNRNESPELLHLNENSSTEIEILIDGYNQMISALKLRERKQAEAEQALKEMNEKLESKVAERTAELVLAKEKAENADKLKSAFLANMSHEIRTPLNAIVGFTSMLISEEFDEQTRDTYIQIVEENTENLLKLIEDILDLSKLESGTLDMIPREVDIAAFIREIHHTSLMLRDRMHKPQVQVTLDLQAELEGAKGFFDNFRIRQVLLNLINNALKFTDDGSVALQVSRNDYWLQFSVSDTGSGIEEKDKPYIFKRFYKSDDTKKIYKGTGLGLAISKSLVELSGGTIRLDPRSEKGTTFIFTIPAEAPAAKEKT